MLIRAKEAINGRKIALIIDKMYIVYTVQLYNWLVLVEGICQWHLLYLLACPNRDSHTRVLQHRLSLNTTQCARDKDVGWRKTRECEQGAGIRGNLYLSIGCGHGANEGRQQWQQ